MQVTKHTEFDPEKSGVDKRNKKGVAFGGTRTHANKVDYDLNVAP